MKKITIIVGLFIILSLSIGPATILAQKYNPRDLNIQTKAEFHDYLARERGKNLLEKTTGAADRKRGILNVGNVEARIRNSATFGYDRDNKCYEFPSGGGISYRWTMAPLVGAIINGQKMVASGTYGAARGHEDEFEPIAGLDGGWSDSPINNFGIAASDRPDTWPNNWPTTSYVPKIGSKGFPGILNGEVVGTRELYFAVTDESNNVGPMNLRVDVWAIQYEDFINEDFIIFRMLVTNVGNETMKNVYLGVHDDPDTPEQGSQEWTDDFAALIPVGTDVEGYTSAEDSLLWNFSYLWDGDDKVQGLIASKVGWVGLKVLETPEDPNNPGRPKGLTTLDVFEYSMAPQTEDAEYDQLASGIKTPDNITPHPDDYTQSPNTYGPDITYVIGSGPFELKPGQSIPFAIASIHGVNKKDLFNNAMLCQILYNNNYSAAEAPPEPNVRAVAGDHSVTLYWNGLKTESAVYADGHVGDKLTGKNAFEGYKIYKSTDRGLTWGETMIDVYGAPRGYIPMAQYDLQNGISGESESRPFFYLGDDTGLRHVLVDNNVENGYEYWYAVLAYDHDDGPIPPLENAFKKDASAKGDNVVAVIPQGKVFGFKLAAIDSYAVHKAGPSDVLRFPVELVDPSTVTGNTYEITFAETDGNKGFTITNLTTSKIASTEVGEVKDWPIYDEMLDNAPIFDGVKIKVTDVAWGWKNTSWKNNSSDAVVELVDFYDMGTCDDYEIRWTGTLGDSGVFSAPPLPFEIFNLTRNAKLMHYMWDDDGSGDWSSGDRVLFVEPDDAFTWIIALYTVDPSITKPPVAGDVFTIITNKSLSAADKYQFTTIKETYSNITHNDLSRITTVPNPFVVSSVYETNKFGIERKLQFHFLPPQCTIRIYSIAGDLIQTVEHTDGTAIESWNLLSYNQQEIAFGVYFYHVDAPNIGTYVGKMAIIK